MRVSNAVTAPQLAKKNDLKTRAYSHHIKASTETPLLHGHKHKNPLTKKERAMSKAYENLIVNLPADKFAAMEATFADRGDADKGAIEVLAALSLIAPKEFQKFIKEGVLKILPSTVQNPASKVALTLFRGFAKLSGVKITEPKTEHFKTRPATAELRNTIRNDFKKADSIAT